MNNLKLLQSDEEDFDRASILEADNSEDDPCNETDHEEEEEEPSEEDEGDDEENIEAEVKYDEDESEKLLKTLEEGVVTKKEANTEACCFYLEDDENLGKLCSSMLKNYVNHRNMEVNCLTNIIHNTCTAMIKYKKALAGCDNTSYSLADSYLRNRHDLLHSLAMDCLRLPFQDSDEPFQKHYPFLDSDRTPDRIIKMEGTCIILETTATLNVYKSFITKGKIEEGFKSKYEREILVLNDQGINTEYFVFIFDVKDHTNKSYEIELSKVSSLLSVELDKDLLTKLDIIRSTFCNYSEEITKCYSNEISNLLTTSFTLEKPILENLDFILKEGESKLPNYKRLTVSTKVFNRIIFSWSRFVPMLSRVMSDYDGNVKPFFEHSNGRFGFMKSRDGVTFNEMMQILVNGDKPAFAKLLVQQFETKPFLNDKPDIEFFDTNKTAIQDSFELDELKQLRHLSSKQWVTIDDIDSYEHLISADYYKERHHYLEDPEYEDKLADMIKEFFIKVDDEEKLKDFFKKLKKKPFTSYDLNEDIIRKSVELYRKKLEKENSTDRGENVIRYQKQPFIHCLFDVKSTTYFSYKNMPLLAIEVLRNTNLGPYTREIFNKISNEKFMWGNRGVIKNKDHLDCLNELKKVHSELNKIQVEHMKSNNLKRLPKLKDVDAADLKNKLSECNKRLSKLVNNKEGRQISQVRLPCRGKSIFKGYFKEEMEHFKSKRSTSVYKGVGILDYKTLLNDFRCLKYEMKASVGYPCPDNVYDNFVSEDCVLLKQFKVDTLKFNESKYNYLKTTGLYHSACFVSRLCHTLAFYSQTATSSDYISIDNLGYDNVVLMVRGGKKVFKTKKSKFFRILYPVYSSVISWYNCSDFSNSVTVVNYKNQNYVLTPWQVMDEVVMNDGITFLHKTISYLMLCHEPEINKAFDKCYFNIMLSFHARRKTEELLHNLRYVCVNSIADFSRLDLMLPELASFNYDFFQSFVRSSISENFSDFSIKLYNYNKSPRVNKDYFKEVELCSLFERVPIENLEDLTMTIYSTFLMSKSPTNQALEQVKNLTNMLNTKTLHDGESSDTVSEQYSMNGKSLDGSLEKYWNDLFDSDFNFDPKYCNLLGKFSADYLSNIMDKGEANNKWMKILNENWDSFANTKGLRGKDKKNFFNKKGYYIVYEEVLNRSDILSEIKNLLTSDKDDFYKRKHLNKLNFQYKTEVGCKNLKKAIFHVVDKKQRGGSREIFVMDLDTKINQQAIEKYISYICKKIPNEAISIPSNRRLQHIHTNVFEKFGSSELEVYNLTLDCRKWAPHSVINKFCDMILGMTNFLPDTFITHFLCFFSKMFGKRIYTRGYIKEIMEKNNKLKNLVEKNLIEDDENGGFYYKMSYSWVMGIFNYMSSFMHVMNQMHISHLIMKCSMEVNNDLTHFHMNAHSDDSGGRVQVKNKFELKKSFLIYELLLKSCNHMLSDKKCNISKRYLEFLSVLYISNNLLSLIAKLSGAFVFHPTDGGYALDINECYSKTIEMVSAGATFEQAYLSMKIMSHLIFKFYFNRDPSKKDYEVPPQILGCPDAHPLIIMIAGGDSDVIRLTYKNKENFNKFMYLSDCFNDDLNLETNLIKPVKVNPNIRKSDELRRHSELLNVSELDENLKWVIKNTQCKNTSLQLLKYGLMLEDKKFISALIDETVTRRISRAYYFRSSDVVKTKWGNVSYKQAKYAINLFLLDKTGLSITDDYIKICESIDSEFKNYNEIIKEKYSLYELLNQEIYNLMESLDNVQYTKEDIIENKKTCKPIHINMQKTGLPTSKDFSPANMCIWIKKPELRWLINLGDDYNNKTLQIQSYLERHGFDLDEVDVNWLFNLLQKLKSKYVKEYFIYSNLPHDMRDISSYKDFLMFLSHNSFKGKQVLGITMPMSNTLSQPMSVIFKNVLPENLINCFTFLNYVFSLTKQFNLFKEMNELKINSYKLGFKENKIYNLLNEMFNYWELRTDYNQIINPHIKSLIKFMDGELNYMDWLKDSYYYCFVKSQKLIGNVWLGKGLLYINLPNIKLELGLMNMKISDITCNRSRYTLNQLEISYINSVLINACLPRLEDSFEKVDISNWEKFSIGLNSTGLICIDQIRNLKIAFPKFKNVMFINNDASNLSTADVTINPNFSYTFYKRSEFSSKKFTVNVLKIDSKEMLDLLMTLYDNEENRLMINEKGEDYKKYLKMFIGNVSGVDMRLQIDQLFDLYQTTKIYHIMKSLISKDLLSRKSIKNRKHYYPGQEGGLLSILIDYKKIDNDFSFDFDTIMTPEMMLIKSTQPEAFVSNLVTNIKEKYNSLYSGLDKSIIKRDLMRLSDVLEDNEYDSKMLSILTNWGYVGVMGAMDELSFKKKIENYRSFRYFKSDINLHNFNLSAIQNLITSIINSATEVNYFNSPNIDIDDRFICKSLKDLKKLFISYVHSVIISVYDSSTNQLTYNTIVEQVKLSKTLKMLFESEYFCEKLLNEFSMKPSLMILPVEKDNYNEVMIMFETLLCSVANFYKSNKKLNFNNPTQHDHDLILPYTVTKEILKKTKLNFDVKKVLYHGVNNKDFLNKLNQHRLYKFEGEHYDINLSTGRLSENLLDFNKSLIIKNPVNEEFIDDDEYYDIQVEMSSDEPYLDDYIDAIKENFTKDYVRYSTLVERGRVVRAKRLNIKTFYFPNFKGNHHQLSGVRNSATTVLIVTNGLIKDLIESNDDKVQIFMDINTSWQNRTLTDPECLLYYLIDSKEININLIEKFLDLKSIDKEVLINEQNNSVTNFYIDERGELCHIEKYMSLEDKLIFLNETAEKGEVIVDEGEFIECVNENLEMLKNQGYPQDFIDEVTKNVKNMRSESNEGIMKDMIKNYITGMKESNELIDKAKRRSKRLLENLEDVNQAIKIYEVATVFSAGVPSKSDIKNRSLKDNYLRAEINTFSPKLIDYILSGMLSISNSCKKIFIKHIKAMKRWVVTDRKDREKKMFLLDLCSLILNDAYDDNETNQDQIFERMMTILTDKIIVDEDEDDDYDFLQTYKYESLQGRLYYDWM